MYGRATAVLLLLLALGGCGKTELYGKLKESDANEMVAVLQNSGISAEKSSEGEAGYSISTSESDFARAVQVLHAQGYPKTDYANLGTEFAPNTMIQSPLAERARLNYALSQQLAHSLSRIDGVVQADVHLAMPEADPLSDKVKAASASVFIKYRPGYSPEKQVGAIKSLVVNGIEGLPYDNVTVAFFPAAAMPEPLPPTPGARIGSVLSWLLLPAALLLAAFVAWPLVRRWQLRRRALMPRAPK